MVDILLSVTPKYGNWARQRAGKALSHLEIPEAKNVAGSSSKSMKGKKIDTLLRWSARRRSYLTKSKRF